MRTAARIIETVEKLIKKYDTRDPYELCKCLGIKIHFYDMEKKLKGFFFYQSRQKNIVIDSNGNWSYYQRAPGAEPAEMDYGTFSYSTDEVSTYYANSTLYDSVSYRVFEIDENSLAWGDEGVYYKME